MLAVSWALVGTSAAFAVLMSVAVGRELHLGPRAFARSFAPGLAAAAGVLARRRRRAARLAGGLSGRPSCRRRSPARWAPRSRCGFTAPRTFVDLVRQLRGLRPAAARAA